MPAKPTVRIPLWGTNHAPQPAGTGNTPQGTNPKIEPSASLIESGFTGPPGSPDYEHFNALFGDGGEWINYLQSLFGDNGGFTQAGSHGVFELLTDTEALALFRARNVNGGANESALQADRLQVGADGGYFKRAAAGQVQFDAAEADQRLEANLFGPLLDEPAPSSGFSKSESLCRHGLIKAKAILNITGTSGSYDVVLLNPGGGDIQFNVASVAFASDGTITLTYDDALTNGSFRQLLIQPFETGAAAVFRSEQGSGIASDTTSTFKLLYQATSGGTWNTFTPTSALASAGSTFFSVIAL